MGRSQLAQALVAGRSCGRNHLGAARGGQSNEQLAGHPAPTIDEDEVVRAHRQGFVDHLRGGQGRNGERCSCLPREGARLSREHRRRGDQQGRPGSLIPQWEGVAEHLIDWLPVLDGISDRRDGPSGLNAERHRRGAADVPLARSDELLPVADPRRPDFNQDLVVREGARIWEVDPPDSAAELADAGGPHQRGAVSAWANEVNTVWVYPRCRVATRKAWISGGAHGSSSVDEGVIAPDPPVGTDDEEVEAGTHHLAVAVDRLPVALDDVVDGIGVIP